MTRKTIRIANVLCAAMLVLYVLASLLSLALQYVTGAPLTLPAGMMLCLSLILPAIVLLIGSIARIKKGGGVLQPILWAISLLLGLAWAIEAFVSYVINQLWIRAINGGDAVLNMPLGRLSELINVLNIASMLFVSVIAVMLLVIFLISLITSKQKMMQLKAGVCHVAASIMILVPTLLSVAQTLLNRVFISLGTDAFSTFVTVYAIASAAINLLLALLLAALVLVFGLVFKKQTSVADAEAAPVQEQGTLPIDLPVGVSAADLDR